MEDDEEIKSHTSPLSEPHSPPPPPPSGRITVTVAATPPPQTTTTAIPPPPNQSSLTLALPIQYPFRSPVGGGVSGGGGGGREDCWSEGATSVLIDAWGERYMELSRGNLKQKHWKEVADIVSSREDYTKPPKTDIQCKNRIDTVKKKYKMEKAKVSAGGGPSRWPFFYRLDRLIGTTTTSSASASVSASSVASAAIGLTAGKAVPVGIPMGVRPFSIPHYFPHHHLQTPLHLQPPQPPPPPPQQQQFRHSNFSPSQVFHKFNPNFNNNALSRGRPMPPAVASVESESDGEERWSPDSGDSLPPGGLFSKRKRPKVEMNNSEIGGRGRREKAAKAREWGNSVRELTRAILKFGEAYEAAESTKLLQIVEMEKQRMKFAKELELQRMKFLMKTQLKLSQLNDDGNNNNNNSDSRCGGGGGGSSGRRSGGGGSSGGGAIGENNHLVHHVNHHTISDSSN